MSINLNRHLPNRAPSRGRGRGSVSGEIPNVQADPERLHYVPPVHLEDMAVGNICWLTEKRQIFEEILCVTKHTCDEVFLRDDAYRHPIVITGLRQRPGSFTPGDVLAQFCVVSSLALPPSTTPSTLVSLSSNIQLTANPQIDLFIQKRKSRRVYQVEA
jgi:hypothetical protein